MVRYEPQHRYRIAQPSKLPYSCGVLFLLYTAATEGSPIDGRDDDARGFPLFACSIPL
jgi:hypothetical protein